MTIAAQSRSRPVLLFDGECAVCRTIARWVTNAARAPNGEMRLTVRPIGDDPADLRSLNPQLDIWEAYATIHVVMPDGSMKLGGEAVAEVFREVPPTRWLAQLCAIDVAGIRPFQGVLNVGYLLLADVRPILGCESCGTSNVVVRFLARRVAWAKATFGKTARKAPVHFTLRPIVARRDTLR